MKYFGIYRNCYYFKKSLTNGLEALDCCSGKSGAKFFLTDDRRYVLKTVTSEDVEVVHDILSDYHKVKSIYPYTGLINNFDRNFYTINSMSLKQMATHYYHIS